MKKFCKFILLSSFVLGATNILAQDYPVSLFGIKSDGNILNTRSIQFGIDYINKQGGGRLVFTVGQYLTGSIHLKSNVTLVFEEGSILLGSVNPFDYDKEIYTALIAANGQQHIGIIGKGVIDGQGGQLAANIVSLIHGGVIKDPMRNDRPTESIRPMLINFRSCESILVENVTLKNAASWVQTYDQCKRVLLDSIVVDSKAYWNNDGIDIVDCDSVTVTHCHIDAADDGICLKSQDDRMLCQHILIDHNIIRSSASAIKFGTVSFGGFSHIRIVNTKIFDTYRSALAIEAVDGGKIDNVVVDSLQATHTGNAIFLRIGERVKGKKGQLTEIHISNLSVEIASAKPDSGYAYEGPVDDQPRNISPAIIIAGLLDGFIDDIILKNIAIKFPGNGNSMIAKVSLTQLNEVPENPFAYPEFSMFGELPAWGMYVRHARGITVHNLLLSSGKKDYRVAVVLDDVHQSTFDSIDIQALHNKKLFYMNHSTGVSVHKKSLIR